MQKTELELALDEVFRGIGRNVLNLQKMEGMLKALVVLVNTRIPRADSVSAIQARRKTVSKMSMGRLVDDFVRSVYPGPSDAAAEGKTDDETMFEYSVKFDDASFVKELEGSLRIIVEERNDLIHKKLMSFAPNSLESCQEFAKDLEEQRQRIKPQYEALRSIGSDLHEHRKEILDYIASDQFQRDLASAKDSK